MNVFELNIRVLGGLLSAHYIAADPRQNFGSYSGCLLDAAVGLADRMLPAFDTKTHIPNPWINLATGRIIGDSRTQCTAGAGTLLLEFGLLTRLTGDKTYHNVAMQALRSLWCSPRSTLPCTAHSRMWPPMLTSGAHRSRRSAIGLVGNTIDNLSGRWTNENAGIGAGVDSFYEYLLKAYVVFGHDDPATASELWGMWSEAYAAVNKYLKKGAWYVQSHMRTGRVVHNQFDSLQAFWPALQVLAGDVGQAVETHGVFYSLWQKFGYLPESYLLSSDTIHPSLKYYPLRPELAESTYALYRVTRDPYYLRVGQHILKSLNEAPRVAGGFATLKDVTTKVLEDR